MDQEEAYFKDILPEIGGYVLTEDEKSFESEEIANELARYSKEEVKEVLEYIAGNKDIKHLERGESGWRFMAFEEGTWEEVRKDLETDDEAVETSLPDVRKTVNQLNPQEYGKIRENLGEVYEGLREIKEERSSYFDAGDIKERVNNVRASEVGLVLSGLAAAGLVKKYGDRNDYEPDSIDTERIREFKDAVESIESFEDFKELVRED